MSVPIDNPLGMLFFFIGAQRRVRNEFPPTTLAPPSGQFGRVDQSPPAGSHRVLDAVITPGWVFTGHAEHEFHQFL